MSQKILTASASIGEAVFLTHSCLFVQANNGTLVKLPTMQVELLHAFSACLRNEDLKE